MKKILLAIGGIVVALVLVAVIVLAYFGFIPGLSKFFMKQKDLGVTYDAELVNTVYADMGFVNGLANLSTPTSSDLVYTGAKELKRDFSSQEISSMLSSWYGHYAYVPFRNVQVRIAEDGTVEFSAMLDVERSVGLARILGYTDDQIDAAKKYVKFVEGELPVYGKGTGSATNNEVTINATTLQVGNITVPSNYVEEFSSGIEDVIEKYADRMPGLEAKSLSFDNSTMSFDGTIPESVGVK